jgi:hypothetical protein
MLEHAGDHKIFGIQWRGECFSAFRLSRKKFLVALVTNKTKISDQPILTLQEFAHKEPIQDSIAN